MKTYFIFITIIALLEIAIGVIFPQTMPFVFWAFGFTIFSPIIIKLYRWVDTNYDVPIKDLPYKDLFKW